MFGQSNSMTFRKGRISEMFQRAYDNIKSTIDGESENYILNVNEVEYSDHLTNKHKLLAPEIHFDQVYADSYEKDIPAKYFPQNFAVFDGEMHKREIIQFFIPCSGNISLLHYGPASAIILSGGGQFEIRTNVLLAEFINFYNNPEEIKRNYDNKVESFKKNYNILIKDISTFNNTLNAEIRSYFNQRKEKILSKNSLLSKLGVSLRKKDNVASTFSVPNPQLKEKIIIKPTVNEKGFKPEPTLDNDNYRKILKLINDVGKNFERMPSIYKDKGEEDLRDFILMTLDPNFEFGSASGETFNKTGKTDIQLRFDSSVIFIAECKFWGGEKKYLATIDQLLTYLTWRDTKAAVVVFVKQKDFTAILEKVQSETSNHSNYLGFVDKSDENWFNFRFHINGDRNREVKMAVQLYHLPTND
jgi:hypothetical protein